jgi:hypothetical protein
MCAMCCEEIWNCLRNLLKYEMTWKSFFFFKPMEVISSLWGYLPVPSQVADAVRRTCYFSSGRVWSGGGVEGWNGQSFWWLCVLEEAVMPMEAVRWWWKNILLADSSVKRKYVSLWKLSQPMKENISDTMKWKKTKYLYSVLVAYLSYKASERNWVGGVWYSGRSLEVIIVKPYLSW